MVPDLERAGGDANVSEAERVSSERSGGWGRISSLLSPSPAAGRRAGWRGGLRSDPSPPESQAPQQGRVSAVLRPEKKAPWAGAPKEQGNSETQLNPFPQPGKPLLHFPVQPGLPKPRGMNALIQRLARPEGRSGAARPCHGHTHLPAHPAALPLAPRCPLPRPTLPPHPLPPRKRLCRTKGRVSWSS